MTSFNGNTAYEHLRVLTEDIGPRHGSSKMELKAAKYIYRHFKGLGLKTSYNEFPIYSFESATASLKDSDGNCYDCKPFPMTANTPSRGVTGDVVVIEDAKAAYLDERVSGKVVVTFNTFSQDDYKLFLAYNPKALVSIQSAHSQLHVAAPKRRNPKINAPTVPSVCLTYTDGLSLLKNSPATLTVKSKTVGEGWRTGKNVIADLSGTEPLDDIIVVCAHYDSVWTGPGAFDNGGGTAAIMELARVYMEKGSKYNLRFCAFGGEEMGLWGSKGYVKSLKDSHDKADKRRIKTRDPKPTELERIRFVVNLDMMGMHPGRSNALTCGHSDIAASVRLLANQQRYGLGIQEDKVYSSDNWYFNMLGVPSLSFNRIGYANGNGHTEGDILDNCNPEGLEHIAGFVETWIDQYVMELHTFPFPRSLPKSSQDSVNAILKGKDPFDSYDRAALLKEAGDA